MCVAKAIRARLAAGNDDLEAFIDSLTLNENAQAPPPPSANKPISFAAIPPLDGKRRVAGFETALDYSFRSAQLRISKSEAASLRRDCAKVFALDSSNWLGATAEPACSLERVARAIFERHTAGVDFDPRTSGAEWWAQVRDAGQKYEGLAFHWDVDENLADAHARGGGVNVHPHLSTVTYLSDHGAPTLVLATSSPDAPTTDEVVRCYDALPSGALSYPRLGKTIVFNGSLLHGAVPAGPDDRISPGGQRVTLLVNVWLGYRPLNLQPLFRSLAESMSQAWRPHPSRGSFAAEYAPPPTVQVRAGGVAQQRLLAVGFGVGREDDTAHSLHVWLPPRPPPSQERPAGGDVARSESRLDSLHLVFDEGAAILGANTRGLQSTDGPSEVEDRAETEGSSSGDRRRTLPTLGTRKRRRRRRVTAA